MKMFPASARLLALVWFFFVAPAFLPRSSAQSSSSSPLAFTAAPQFLPGTGWRLVFRSEAGGTYRIDRSTDLQNWTLDIGTVTASGPSTVFTDPDGTTTGHRFWRAVQLSAGDTTPPVISAVDARMLFVGGVPALQFRVTASDNVAVAGVLFLDGANLALGDGGFDAVDAFWKITQPVPGDTFAVREVKARARDAAGNLTDSPLARFTLFDATRFARLDSAGEPIRGAPPTIDALGNLGPFAMFVGGGGALGPGADLVLRFPNGGRIVTQGSQKFIEFGQANATFGPDSPFEFVSGPVLQRGGGRALQGALSLKQLPIGSLTVADIVSAFDLPAEQGLALRIFQKFETNLKVGSLLPEGLLAPQFAFDPVQFPGLPTLSSLYAGLVIDLSDPRAIRLPFSGEIPIADGTANPPVLRVPAENPLWLTLRADGSLALEGRAELSLPATGLRIRVEVRLDDPSYRLRVSADTKETPLLDQLGAVLPTPPASVNPTLLDAESARLAAFQRAFRHFSAGVLGSAPTPATAAALNANPPLAPPTEVPLLAHYLDAWTESAATGNLGALGTPALTALQNFSRQLALAGSGARDLRGIASDLEAAVRARAVLAPAALQPALDSAIADLETAIIARAGEPRATSTLADLVATCRTLASARQSYQALGRAFPVTLEAGLSALLNEFLAAKTRALGVNASEYAPPTGGPVAGLARLSALQQLRDLRELLTAANQLGLQSAPGNYSIFTSPVGEMVNQLAARAASTTQIASVLAESKRDYRALLVALEDLVDLVALRQLGFFPGAGASALNSASLPATLTSALINRLDAGSLADAAKAVEERSWFDRAGDVARLTNILADIEAAAPNLAFLPDPFQRAYNALEPSLGAATSAGALAAVTRPGDLVRLLAAGSLHDRLARRFGGSGASWDNSRLPLVVARLQALAGAQRSWSELFDAARLLLAEADQIGAETLRAGANVSDLNARRARYLNQLAALAGTARSVALALQSDVNGRRSSAGPTAFTLNLPGEVQVMDPWGALDYERTTGALRGALGGRILIPGLIGTTQLDLKSLTLSNRGAFDLTASGVIDAMPLGALTGSLEVLPRRPLRIRFREGQPLAVAGSARLTLSNGFYFEGYLDFRDPLYKFGAATGGVRFDLANQLLVNLPPNVNFSNVPANLAPVWARYLQLLGAAVEPLVDVAQTPLLGQPGRPPEFKDPAIAVQYADLGAFVEGVKVDATFATANSLNSFLSLLREHLSNASRSAAQLSGALEIQRKQLELQELNGRLRDVIRALPAGTARDSVKLDTAVRDYATAATPRVRWLVEDPFSASSVENARAALKIALDHDATLAELGLPSVFLSDPTTAALLETGFGNRLVDLGLSRTTGVVANAGAFHALSRIPLFDALAEFFEIQSELQLTGGESLNARFKTAALEIGRRLRALTAAELQATAASDWQRRSELSRDLTTLAANAAAGFFEPDATLAAQIQSDLAAAEAAAPALAQAREADAAARAANPFYEVWSRLRDGLRRAGGTPLTLDEISRTRVRREMQPRLDALAVALPLNPAAIGDLATDLRSLADLCAAAEDLLGPADALSQSARTKLIETSQSIPGLAAAQRAWWEIGEYARLLNEGLSTRPNLVGTAAGNAFREALNASLSSGLGLIHALRPQIQANRPLDIRLPGDLVVRRAFGDFLYRRTPPLFTATFGGLFEFPEVGASFAINNASISSSGAWSLSLAASGVLNAGGGGDQLRYRLNDFTLSGTFNGGINAGSGNGEVQVTRANDPGGPPDVFSATIFYGQQGGVGPRFFELTTGASGKFVFDPNFVVFNASLGLRFTSDFRSGRLSTGGTAGFFHRGAFNEATVTPNDFEFTLQNVALVYTYSPTGFMVELSGGALLLPVFEQVNPPVDCTGTGPLAARPAQRQIPSVTLGTPIRATVTYASGSTPTQFTFGTPGGQPIDLAFANLGLTIPGLPDFRLDICSANLRLPVTGGSVPILQNFNAKLEIPLPNDASNQPQRVRTRLAGKNWRLNGFPEQLSVTLDQNFRLVDQPSLKLDILAAVADCSSRPAGLDFFTEPGPNAGETTNAFTIRGGARIETNVVVDATSGGSVAIGTCGSLTLRFDYNAAGVFQRVRPDIGFNQVTLSGAFRLGGPQGIQVTGPSGGTTPATIALQNLPNFLAPNVDQPFRIALDGRVTFGSFGAFVLDGANFAFTGSGLPTFHGRLALVAGQQLQALQGSSALPITISEVGLTFLSSLPLDQAFRPENLQVDLTGFADFKLPTGQGDATSTGEQGPGSKIPRIYFALDHFKFGFPNGFGAAPTLSTNGLSGQIENLNVGDFAGLTGGLSLQGLTGPVEAVTIGGVVGATIKGVGAKVALAAKMSGLVTLCLDVNLGPAGIPLDGGALGGVLLTGANGGVNFANQGAADPCSAFARLGFGLDGRPLPAARGSALERARIAEPVGLTWGEAFARADALERAPGRSLNFNAVPMAQSPDPGRVEERRARAAAVEVARLTGVPLDPPAECPTGDCPPATLNLLCQLHPSHGQAPGAGNYNGQFANDAIVKFTSLSSAQVDAIITAAGLDALLGSAGVGQGTTNATIATQFSTQVRTTVSGLIPRLPQGAPGEIDVNLAIEDALDLLRDTLRNVARSGLDLATGGLSPREALRKAGYAGLKCQDVTLKLHGTLSHAAVSTFLALDGGYTVSTRGFGSIDGAFKLVGIPVGTANLSLALSNASGDFAPILCGSVSAGLGPLEFGGLRLRFDPGLNTSAVLTAMGTFLSGLGGDAAETIYQMIDAANGPTTGANRGVPLIDFFQPSYAANVPADSRLTPAQQQAVIAQLFNLQNLTSIAGLSPAGLANLRDRAQTLIIDVALALNPDLRFCGTIEPKLFGLGLGGGETAGVSLSYSKQPASSGPGYDVLAGSFTASPSWILFNYGLVLGSAGQIPPFIPGIDSAEIGFATRARSFDKPKLQQFFADPATVVGQRMGEAFQNSLVTFQYSLKPFGLELGNTQVRVFMPQFAAHPRRNGVTWNPPTDSAFPGSATETAAGRLRREIILRAGTANLIKESTWLGTPSALEASGKLGALFTDTGDSALIGRMNALDLGRDVFPYGGVLGSGRLALPRPLTDGLPGSFFTIFDATKTLQQRFDAFTATASFLTSTRQVGDLAFYFPAPNPPSALLNGTLDVAGLGALATAMGSLDYTAITRGTRDANFYAFDQVFLRGALSIPVLGIPVAQGRVTLNGLNGTFELQGSAPAGSWLSQLGVTAEFMFSVGPPKAAIDKKNALALTTPPNQPLLAPRGQSGIDGLTDVIARYSGLTPATLNFTQLQTELYAAMPRVELVSNVTLNLNRPELANFFQPGSGTAIRLFAYSPGFDPAAAVPPGGDPLNPDPQTLARRQGGAGIAGSMLFGYFPGGNANDPAAIRIAVDTSLAILAPAEGSALPALSGLIQVPAFSIPGGVSFSGLMQFNTQPANLGNYLSIVGSAAPISFSAGGVNLLTFQPLAPATSLGGTVTVQRKDSVAGGLVASLTLNPMSASIPLLGPGVAVTLHGGPNGSGGFNAFGFTSAPGVSWSAFAALSAPGNPNAAPTFVIRDPFNPNSSQSLLEFTPSGPVSGSITGVGTTSFQMSVTIPTGFTATFYKGTAQESTVALPTGQSIQIHLDSAGRFYCDLGSLTNLNLPGLLSANARLEFGYNPEDPQPNVTRSPSSFGFGTVNLADTVSQAVTISNTGTLLADIALNLVQTDPDKRDYELGTGNFQLEPGGSRTVRVTFNPKKAGTRTATLQINSNDPDSPQLTVSFTGTGLQQERFAVSRPSVAFGDTVVGATSVDTITVTNTGSATMTIPTTALTGTGFTVSPTTSQSLVAGASKVYALSYSPAAIASSSGMLTFNVTNLGAQNVAVTGRGTDTRWVTLLDAASAGSTAQLNAIRMLDASRGYVVGNGGRFLETRDGGRSWTPRKFTLQNLTAIAVDRTTINNALLAVYHFEEPPGSAFYLDGSGNARHGAAVASPKTAEQTFTSGRFGSGLHFDGVDDYADLGLFALPSSFSISVWVKFETTADGQAILGKHTTSGSNQFVFGKYGGGLRVTMLGTDWTVPHTPALNTWTHFIIVATYDSTANTTTVTLFRGLEGGSSASLGTNVFTGQLSTAGGKAWTVGQDWDSSTTASDFFKGSIDEIWFFDGSLNSTERNALFRTNTERLAVVGTNGTVLQSFTGGTTWGQHPDLNAYGWRNQARAFQDNDWNAAAFNGGKLYLGGSIGLAGGRLIMVEGINVGVDGLAGTADDEFDEVSVTGGLAVALPRIFGLASVGSTVRAAGSDGVVFSQNVPDGADSAFAAQSPNAAPSALNAIAAFGSISQFVAVGTNGSILQADNAAPVARTSGTNAVLYGVSYNAALSPGYHVVGDAGTYLTSANNGVNWQVVADGLSGNMRGVDTAIVPGGSSSEYSVWAVGQNHAINLRPPSSVTGPLMTFFPGSLDFGFVTTNEGRTLEVTIANRGKTALQLSSLSFAGPAAARYSLGQSIIDRIEPGDTAVVPVRYRPIVAADFDSAELVVSTNEAGASFRIPLRGRSGGADWRPIVLPNGATGLAGEVIKIAFSSTNVGYALVDLGVGTGTRLYRTSDGGQSWTNMTGFPNVGGILRLTGLGAIANQEDAVYVSGRVENASGTILRGIFLGGQVGEQEIAPGEFALQQSWNDRTPGGTSQPLAVGFLDVFDNSGVHFMVAATTGNTSTANIFRTENGGGLWTTASGRPASNYNGGPLKLAAYAAATGATNYYAGSGGELYFASVSGTNWPATAKRLVAGGVIRDTDLYLDIGGAGGDLKGWVVGDGGLFFRIVGTNQSTPDKIFPAGNAEVFGTSSLLGVSFFGSKHGWVISSSQAFESQDGGSTWGLGFDAGTSATFRTVMTRTSTALIGGALDGKATIWRYAPPPVASSALVSVAAQVDFGSFAPDAAPSRTLQLTNSSSNTLAIHDLTIVSEDGAPRFRLTGTPPSSLGAGASTTLTLKFDDSEERSLAAALAPEFFLRFEGSPEDVVFRDDSPNGRDTVALATANQPQSVRSSRRDRAVRFDGTDDRIELPNPVPALDVLPANFSVSIWAAPESISGTRTLVSKDLATGGDGFKFSQTSTGYQVKIRSATATFTSTPALDWTHLVVTCANSGGTTAVTLFRDGAAVGTVNLAATAGDLTGRPWTLGAEWTSASATAAFFVGSLDDVALFFRALSESEVAQVGARSPLYGEHRAQLIINSGSENGRRAVDLRATVTPASATVVFRTEPEGRALTIDGVDYTSPVAFTVAAYATGLAGGREWVEGSQHRIATKEATYSVSAADGTVTTFAFSEWEGGGPRSFAYTASRSGAAELKALFVPTLVTPPGVAAPPTRTTGPNPLLSGLANSPKGPFFRLSNGQLKLPNLGATGFAISGELLVSLSKIKGHLSTTALNLPDSGDRHVEIGASRWLLDATAGGNFTLAASPPSLKVLGVDVLPNGQAVLRYTKGVSGNPDTWGLEFTLRRDFKPWPDAVEFKKGLTKVTWLASGLPGFALEFQGGLRLLKLPGGTFAFDRTMTIKLDTVNFDVGLNDFLPVASRPADLLNSGVFAIGWGDIRLKRVNGGAISLNLVNLPLRAHGQTVVNVNGSLTTDGALSVSGNLASGNTIRLDPSGRFFLEKTGSGTQAFELLVQALPSPRLKLTTPALRLKTTATGANGNVFGSSGIPIPGITLDTSGAFDTGKLPLPVMDFDGITIAGDSNGRRKDNHIRLQRDEDGKTTFSLKSEQQFFGCRQDLSLKVTAGSTLKVTGSFRGNFCLLPEPLSLTYSNSSSCQFSGSAFGFTVRFGPGCAQVLGENPLGGNVCLLGCP